MASSLGFGGPFRAALWDHSVAPYQPMDPDPRLQARPARPTNRLAVTAAPLLRTAARPAR